jgi:DNA modification methylase
MMMMMMISEAGWQVKHELIWVKNNHVLGRADYFYKHEPILYGWSKKHTWYGKGEFNKSVWEIDKPSKSDLHPTMKPVRLMVNALLNSTKEKDICIDYFLGSGSTLIACEKTNRICYGIELDPIYIDVIINRWENFTGETAVKL